MKVFFIILSVTLAYAEPPSNEYLPALRGFTSPSDQYGIPSVAPTYIPPSSYGAPIVTYGVPPTTYGAALVRQPLAYTPKIYSALQGRPLFNPNVNLAPKYGAPKYLRPYGVDEPANYNFKYDVQAAEYGTEFGHEETRQGDVAQGRYYTLLPDGRRQIVEYVADAGGYRPKITYEQVAYPQATAGYHY